MPCRQRRTGEGAGFGTYNHDTLCVISALVSCGWWAAPAGARLFFRCIFSGGRPDSIKRIFPPRITRGIFRPIAAKFLHQIKEEFEQNLTLKLAYPDVLYANPRTLYSDGRPSSWSVDGGITVKRRTNPKESTIEAHGLIDGQPTSRHFRLHVYDDVVTQDYLSDDQIKKTTERWE